MSSSVTTKGIPLLRRYSSSGSQPVDEASEATALRLNGSIRTRRTAETVAKAARTSFRRGPRTIIAMGSDEQAAGELETSPDVGDEVEGSRRQPSGGLRALRRSESRCFGTTQETRLKRRYRSPPSASAASSPPRSSRKMSRILGRTARGVSRGSQCPQSTRTTPACRYCAEHITRGRSFPRPPRLGAQDQYARLPLRSGRSGPPPSVC